MRITASPRAAEVVAEMSTRRSGTLTVTIGTGCCESTAPFLYEDFLPGADMEPVGEVEGVVIWAPEYLRRLYPDEQGARLDVVDELAESLSVETELGVRLVLRGTGLPAGSVEGEAEACRISGRPSGPPVDHRVKGSLPPELARPRMR